MSYILEALKQSQRERDLGSVPTPVASLSTAQGDGGASNLGVFVAVGTALFAMAIALFALMQARWPGSSPPDEAESRKEIAAEPSVARRSTPGESAAVTLRPATRPASVGRAGTPVPAGPESDGRTAPPELPAPDAAPELEATAGAEALEETDSAAIEHNRLRETEALRERLLDLSQRESAAPKVPPGPVPIPEDLRNPRPAAVATPGSGAGGYPEAGGLPSQIQRSLPERTIRVHVYNPAPEKRFVLVNAQRLREGGATTDGLVVEEIRSDGVVFGFQGHRFFQRR